MHFDIRGWPILLENLLLSVNKSINMHNETLGYIADEVSLLTRQFENSYLGAFQILCPQGIHK